MRYTNFTPEHEKAFLELMNASTAATFIYCKNVCNDGKLSQYDKTKPEIRTIAISGVVFVPVLFFTDYLKVGCAASKDEYVLTANDNTLKIKASSTEYSLNDSEGSFALAPVEKKGVLYLPAYEVAKLLGYAAGLYYEKRFIVVGDAAVIKALDESEALAHAGSYVIFGECDADALTPADYKVAKDKWRKKLVGSPEINDLSNPVVVEKIAAIENDCEKWWSQMNKDPGAVILWGDTAPVESDQLGIQYGRINRLAKGYAAYGSKFYKNEQLLADIIFGMDWMYEHMFGEAEIAGTGWRDVHAFNWWYWYVGAPEHITDIIFLIEDKITHEQKKKWLKCFEWIYTWMMTQPGAALTRISVCTKVALALEDPEYLKVEFKDFDKLLHLYEGKGSPHVDYVDFTHGLPHNTSYGRLHLDRVHLVASMLAGSAIELANPQLYMHFMLAKYMFEASMYKCQAFVMFMGRSTFAIEMEHGSHIISDLLPMIGVFGDDEDAYLKKMIKRNTADPAVAALVRKNCSLLNLATYESIMKDDSISVDNDYEYAHAWFTGDRAAQHRNDYAFGIAMSSRREPTYECINDANKTGWYLGDGATYLYTNYDRHQYDGKNYIDNIDIAYHLAGTTEDDRPRVIRSIRGALSWRPDRSFAGAVQFEDKYITATMDFEAMHKEPPEDDYKDTGYGGPLAVHLNDLVSKKSWFCFDNEVIALSAGINSTMDANVNTTLEHRRIVREDEFNQYLATEEGIVQLDKAPYEKHLSDVKWANMQGHAGYVLLEKADTLVRRYNCEATGDQPYFEFRIKHGKNPKNASYAYAIIPYATNEQLEEYYKNPDVEIISNTAELQAVREKTLGISSYVFHKAGSCEGVSVSSPCIVMLSEKNGEVEICINDPSHELEGGVVIIDKLLSAYEIGDRLKSYIVDGKTVIVADFKDANGRALRAKFN